MAAAHRIYARALFEAAKERGRLAEVGEQFGDFVQAVRDVPELRNLLRNPQVDRRARQVALEDLLGDADELVRNFMLVTAEKGRAGQIEEIHREFERLVADEEGRLSVEVTTAFELSQAEARRIVEQIERASGRRIDAIRKVDPALIGGLVLQAGSLRVDASVRGRLERLRQELATARR